MVQAVKSAKLRALLAATTKIGSCTNAQSLMRRPRTRGITAAALALTALAGPPRANMAMAEPIQWADVAPCYDRGVAEKKPIVLLVYDKMTSRVDADMVATRLSLSPRIQAVASKAVWCFGDISSDLVSRNISKALQIASYPSVSVLAPNGEMLDEAARVAGMSARIDGSASEEATEKYIVLQIQKLSAQYSGRR